MSEVNLVRRRFVGGYAEIIGTPYKFTRFGQLVELPEDLANKVKQLVSEEEFDDINFTTEELQQFANVSKHTIAPPEFIAKRDAAWALVGGAKKENTINA